MRYCKNCKISIIDDTELCPFCRCVTDSSDPHEPVSTGIGGYPDAFTLARKFRFVGNLVLFVSIAAVIICTILDMHFDRTLSWSLIVLLGLIYANTILQFAIIGRSSYRGKAIILTLMGILIGYGIDELTGFQGWSLNYCLPGGILFLDLGILVLMIVNRRNWQSYMMTQILMIFLSLCMLILYFFKYITHPILMQIAIIGSILLFVGTLIIGDARARTELKRRFHF